MPTMLPRVICAADADYGIPAMTQPYRPLRHRAHILADVIGDERMFGAGALHNLVAIEEPDIEGIAFLDLVAYSSDQARDERGRFASGDHTAAKEAIGRVLKGEKTAAAQKELMGHLGKLSTKELNSLRKEHGLKASGKTKAALAEKLHDRLAKGRWSGPEIAAPSPAHSEGKPDPHWGNKAVQPYYRPGANPTVDNVITRSNPKSGEKEILLIRRTDKEGVTERGKWALPGGFHDTTAAKGEPWKPGLETAKEAAVRELHEETGLDAHSLTQHLREVGSYEGGGRDPRDNKEAWSKSTAFHLHLPAELASKVVRGQDDADKAAWKPISQAKGLAFDHDKIVADAMKGQAPPKWEAESVHLLDGREMHEGGITGYRYPSKQSPKEHVDAARAAIAKIAGMNPRGDGILPLHMVRDAMPSLGYLEGNDALFGLRKQGEGILVASSVGSGRLVEQYGGDGARRLLLATIPGNNETHAYFEPRNSRKA